MAFVWKFIKRAAAVIASISGLLVAYKFVIGFLNMVGNIQTAQQIAGWIPWKWINESSWWIAPVICVVSVFSIFIAGRYEKKKNNGLKEPAAQLGGSNPLLFSCGKSVDQSIILANGITWFRARMELNGTDPIRNISAHVTAIRKDGEKLQLNEVVNLTLH